MTDAERAHAGQVLAEARRQLEASRRALTEPAKQPRSPGARKRRTKTRAQKQARRRNRG